MVGDRKKRNLDHYKGSYSKEVILLQDYKWVLLKNHDDIKYNDHMYYNRKLRMNVDTYRIENMFFSIDDRLRKYHRLKEMYIEFNNGQYQSEKEISEKLNYLIKVYKASEEKIFQDFASFLDNHSKEIINSFTTVKVHRGKLSSPKEYESRLSNGLIESLNRKPKDYIRNTRGASNFYYTRNRILWATRKDAQILTTPKQRSEVHSYRLSKKTMNKRNKKYKK